MANSTNISEGILAGIRRRHGRPLNDCNGFKL
jgi:hypothetical protein